ncbi:hypothetical protein BGX31_000498 [Mortierella sp. GBA43]|nr:hypothetical protein BGX31_000498 [Mortierella sp. GBA43]
MADEKSAHPVFQSRQPVVAVDMSKGSAPVSIPGSSTTATLNSVGATSPPDASTSPPQGKKTGTRSTFCPNTLRKSTKLTEEDYEHHEDHQAPQPTGWLQMLGLKKSANYGDPVDSNNDGHQQSYY